MPPARSRPTVCRWDHGHLPQAVALLHRLAAPYVANLADPQPMGNAAHRRPVRAPAGPEASKPALALVQVAARRVGPQRVGLTLGQAQRAQAAQRVLQRVAQHQRLPADRLRRQVHQRVRHLGGEHLGSDAFVDLALPGIGQARGAVNGGLLRFVRSRPPIGSPNSCRASDCELRSRQPRAGARNWTLPSLRRDLRSACRQRFRRGRCA